MDEKIRILFLSANPQDTGHIRLDRETREVCDGLDMGSARDEFELITYPALRPSDFPRLLLKHRPHIVHFSGHGSLADQPAIILEDDSGESKRIETESLVNLFRIFLDDVRLVILNACNTKAQAQALAHIVDYTIGTSAAIGDRVAREFAAAFYRALAFKRSIKDAFELGTLELSFKGSPQSDVMELFIRNGVSMNQPFLLSARAARRDGDNMRQRAVRSFHAVVSTEKEMDLNQSPMRECVVNLEPSEEATESDTEVVKPTDHISKPPHITLVNVPYRRMEEPRLSPVPSLAPTPFDSVVVGREDALEKVKGLLQSVSTVETSIKLIVVRGWPGVGKTTFVDTIGRDHEALKALPDGVLWTSLGSQPDLIAKLADWCRTLGMEDVSQTLTLDEAVAKLAALIRHRRILLIVDDVWDEAHMAPFLRVAAGSECVLLTTTRLTKVAEALTWDEKRIYVLPPQPEDKALVLLSHRVPVIVEQYPEECRKLILALGCLPLSILVAARLLKAEANMGLDIVNFLNRIKEVDKMLPELAPLNSVEGVMLPTVHTLLKRSTDSLDQSAREHFALLSAFAPKPATFDVDAMKAVWEVIEPTATIRKLVGFGLLEPTGTGCFQMDPLLAAHARSLLTDDEDS